MKRKSLGRGLEALIPEQKLLNEIPLINVDVEKIFPGEHQPRKTFDDIKLSHLVNSIKSRGIIQPIILKEENGGYKIIAGERRWRAAKIAGIKTVPAIIKDVSQRDAMELALIENIQREDLNPIEEAQAYKRLIEEYQLTHEELSEKVGKNRATISNYLRLLNLPKEVKNYLFEEKITMGHAKVVAGLQNQKDQISISKKVYETGLSVRTLENLVQNWGKTKKKKLIPSKASPEVFEIEEKLKRTLATKVKLFHNEKKNCGRIQIEYYSIDDLERILNFIK
ncbi:MAG: hypothetical protein A3C43_09565 [Candidatus Schekmanbacteria bacterium RIFCSPHIGHO2_02_FULL_38_11]|uniref:ParB-like N-terminal domain-containing protein n=1 Tax=Candidatus Schekmanbacteria bacterium RIFCSPLOWO2_12_FULL_38_15 TaxID=1817883 RepID=A0A1F7SIM8_9BACT|nr:MAG: hypothetical protein A2043_10205 [Candidatus Schekmanbacteria bacterium GWA2_38_9]OGL49439.1 MAG: hypothetical protein A3H37_10035 [Candidatus Schekmanbacteria bacterium RIFCSPLOWO2_02_FULL_38_14]OGL53631.1 MAG: hypothetical protein A3G31_04945 [Candidatus Schekmanbacteria bacterium RIFCSPLOWO2_12_FULL_38_15]OGL55559.1 MAG: hypothetical protein A3C43_09565 [Candidatus Schekmanbacteria bacterium RIFCSPHIGHO2_02_FULL_38_11]